MCPSGVKQTRVDQGSCRATMIGLGGASFSRIYVAIVFFLTLSGAIRVVHPQVVVYRTVVLKSVLFFHPAKKNHSAFS